MKTIYISGPITDNKTGQPREGWQKRFMDAEAKLRAMSFRVVNPVDISMEVKECWLYKSHYQPSICVASAAEEEPTRADYVMACLLRIKMNHDQDNLQGVYLIGDVDGCRASHGVQMELHMAELLGIPVFAEFRADNEIWTDDLRVKSERTIEGLLKE